MRLFNGYLGRTIFGANLLVLLVVVGLHSLGSLIDELRDVEGNYTFVEALIYVGMSAPGTLQEYLPFSALVGCLIGLGLLASSSELVVMRAAGISVARVVWMVLRPVLLLTLIGLAVAEFVAPQATLQAEVRRAVAQSTSANIVSARGVWHREGQQYMRFNAVHPDGILFGVTLYRFDGQRRLESALYARRAVREDGGWVLENATETRFSAERIHRASHKRLPWDVALPSDLLDTLSVKPEDMSLRRLLEFSAYRRDQGLRDAEYRLAFWNKALQPLAVVSLVLVAISFIFGPLRQVTMGLRIFTGVLVGIAFHLAQSLLGPSSMVFGFSPLYASLLPIGVCLLVGGWLLRRVR